MSAATNSRRLKPGANQLGATAIEFAVVVTVFLIVVFGILEIARAMYMFNTLAEVTRRAANAAARTPFDKQDKVDLERKRAVFDEASGTLPWGTPITYRNVRIEYLYLPKSSVALTPVPSLPSCPVANRHNCLTNPNGANCIRAVKASICKEGEGDCEPVDYVPFFPFAPPLPLVLPRSVTIVPAGTFGYRTGDPCS